jgi:outer membrane murein-binding lipoprotein Lpp
MQNKIESLSKEVKDLKTKIEVSEKKAKQEVTKLVAEREELIKAKTKVEHKEA